MVTVAEALALGTRHHQSGQLAEAEQIYRQILSADPGNPDALHLLGTLALQANQFPAAIELIGQAIRGNRSVPAYYANLGEAYRHHKMPREAIDSYRKALKLCADLPEVQAKLAMLLEREGQLAEAEAMLREAVRMRPADQRARTQLGHLVQSQNRLSDAEACFRRVLRESPQSADSHFNLGAALQAQGKVDDAAACYRSALAIQPDHADAHNNLGTILQLRGELKEAYEHFKASIQARPDDVSGHANLAANLESRDLPGLALACHMRVVELDPGNMTARNTLGLALLGMGRMTEAEACFRECIQLRPDHAASHLNLGNALQMQGKLVAAMVCMEAALAVDPQNADAYNNIGMIRNEQGLRDEAIAACRRAIELRPTYAQPYNNLAVAYVALGRLDEAIEYARKSSELSPTETPHHSNLLYMVNYHPGWKDEQIFAEHRQWGQRYADPLTARSAPHTVDRSLERRLRIGYVSAHFTAHAVNFFSEPILASHDHSQFEIFCYANLDHEDETTARLRTYADHWRDISRLSDDRAAALVRDDQIDILVDLTGHIGGNRMYLFARKPAPVQVTYIGYQNTTGMAAMDYRITDEWSDPPGKTDAYYTEKLVRLPRSFFCYQPSGDAPPVNPLPAIERGFVTFGSFNNFAKITPQVLDAWITLLESVPDSRLIVLANAAQSLIDDLTRTVTNRGIAGKRLTLADRRPRLEYLELIRQADIALDPFPFNGHTTTCDALWQGLPVVSLAGHNYVSRFGSSALVSLGLEELIAHSTEEYVRIAAGLAGDLPRLAELRATMRARMAASPILDFAGFTCHLESAYRQMWRQWCAEHPAEVTQAAAPTTPVPPEA